MDSVALLAACTSEYRAAAIESLPQFTVLAHYGEHSLLQMSEDWYALLGPDADDGAGQWASLSLPCTSEWSADFESFGTDLLTHFYRL